MDVRHAQSDDRRIWIEEFYTAYKAPIQNYIGKKYPALANQAEDIFHEVVYDLMVCNTSLEVLQAKKVGYFIRIAHNKCFDIVKKKWFEVVPLEPECSLTFSLPLAYDYQALVVMVQKVLTHMSSGRAMIIGLHLFEGLSVDNIKQITGFSRPYLSVLKCRAYSQLREILREQPFMKELRSRE